MRKENCLFELIYFKKEETMAIKTTVANTRIEIGKLLAERCPVEGGCVVVPVPETAILFAQGYSLGLNIPFIYSVFKKRPKLQTLFIKDRKTLIGDNFFIVPELVRDRKIVLVDETIISGLSLSIAIRKLKEAKVKEIHVRVVAPMRRVCPWENFVEPWTSIEDITDYADYLGIDSFEFLDDEDLNGISSCAHCFLRGPK